MGPFVKIRVTQPCSMRNFSSQLLTLLRMQGCTQQHASTPGREQSEPKEIQIWAMKVLGNVQPINVDHLPSKAQPCLRTNHQLMRSITNICRLLLKICSCQYLLQYSVQAVYSHVRTTVPADAQEDCTRPSCRCNGAVITWT